jgi:hypothetical protein
MQICVKQSSGFGLPRGFSVRSICTVIHLQNNMGKIKFLSLLRKILESPIFSGTKIHWIFIHDREIKRQYLSNLLFLMENNKMLPEGNIRLMISYCVSVAKVLDVIAG